MPKKIFTVWKVALFAGLLAFSLLLWLNDDVGYSAKSAFLLNGKNGNQEDILAKTVAALGNTHTFVERTVGSTRLQESAVGHLSPEEQQALVKAVKVRGGKHGGVVIVESEHTDAEIAEVMSTESTETLLRMSRLYVGNEQEFTSTVIDQAILSKGLIHPAGYVLKSLATAILLFSLLLLLAPAGTWLRRTVTKMRIKGRSETEEHGAGHQEAPDQRFVPQKLDPAFLYPERGPEEVFVPQPKASEVINSEVYGHPEEATGKSPLQSVSVSMEDLPFTFETPVPDYSPDQNDMGKEEKGPAGPSVQETLPADKEPSVLEYKRRLNELLAQK